MFLHKAFSKKRKIALRAQIASFFAFFPHVFLLMKFFVDKKRNLLFFDFETFWEVYMPVYLISYEIGVAEKLIAHSSIH
jgi:hypothetical protein